MIGCQTVSCARCVNGQFCEPWLRGCIPVLFRGTGRGIRCYMQKVKKKGGGGKREVWGYISYCSQKPLRYGERCKLAVGIATRKVRLPVLADPSCIWLGNIGDGFPFSLFFLASLRAQSSAVLRAEFCNITKEIGGGHWVASYLRCSQFLDVMETRFD